MRPPRPTTLGVALMLAAIWISTAWQPDQPARAFTPADAPASFWLDREDDATHWSLRVSGERLQLFARQGATITHWLEALLDTETAQALWARIDALEPEDLQIRQASPAPLLRIETRRDGRDQRIDVADMESGPASLVTLCDELLGEARRLGRVPSHAERQAWLATPLLRAPDELTPTPDGVELDEDARAALATPGWLAPASGGGHAISRYFALDRPVVLQRLDVALRDGPSGT